MLHLQTIFTYYVLNKWWNYINEMLFKKWQIIKINILHSRQNHRM
mgnify:CR=1 FL=1